MGAATGAPLAALPINDKEEEGLEAGASAQPAGADENDDKCVVCLEDLGRLSTRFLDCKHGFHAECINTWEHAYRHHTCPNCRAPFREPFPRDATDVEDSWDLGDVEDDWDRDT